MQQREPVAGYHCVRRRRDGHLTKEATMLRNLDVVDWCLLVGVGVYFGLLVLRRI